jgi:hypothetical protein
MRTCSGPLCTKPTAELDFIVLAHWNNNLRVDMSLNSDTLFWFHYYQQVNVVIFRFLPFVFMKKWFSVQWGLLNNVEKCCIYSHTWLCQYNNNLRVDMSLNSDTLFWFRANLLSEEATDNNFIFFNLTRTGLEPTI